MLSHPISTADGISFRQIRKLVNQDSPTIIEVGAHHGVHTEQFLRTFQSARIYAFEPDPRAIAKFEERIRDPRVRLFKTAVGARDGSTEFHASSGLPPGLSAEASQAIYPLGWDQSGSIRKPKNYKKFWPWLDFNSTFAVPVTRLDTWAEQHSVVEVDFIWADMQGAEGELIDGGSEVLRKTRFLYIEYSNNEIYEGEPTLAELLQLLPSFAVVTQFPGDVLLRNKDL